MRCCSAYITSSLISTVAVWLLLDSALIVAQESSSRISHARDAQSGTQRSAAPPTPIETLVTPEPEIRRLPALVEEERSDTEWRNLVQPTVTVDDWWNRELSRPILRAEKRQSVTLAEAQLAAIETSPELESVRALLAARGLEITRRNAAFDWVAFADASWKDDSNPIGSQLDGAARRLRAENLTVRGGARRTNTYGGRLQASQDATFRDSNSQFFAPHNQGASRMVLEYKQPLLRGAGQEYNTAPQQLAEIDEVVASFDLQTQTQDRLLDVSVAYWTLALQRGRLAVYSRSWRRAFDIAEVIELRQHVDASGRLRLRARAEAAARQARARTSEFDVMRAQETFLRAMLGGGYGGHNELEFCPETRALEMEVEVPLIHEIVEEGLFRRPEVAAIQQRLRAAAIERNMAEKDIQPLLDMVLSSYVAGLRSNYNIGSSFADQFSKGEPGYAIGLVGELPYGNRAAKAVLEQKSLLLKRFESDMQTLVADIGLQIRDATLAEQQSQATLQSQRNTLSLALEEMNYVQTRQNFLADGNRVADLYLNDLLQTQSRLEAAELAVLQAEIEVAINHTRRTRATATLLNQYSDKKPLQETKRSVKSTNFR